MHCRDMAITVTLSTFNSYLTLFCHVFIGTATPERERERKGKGSGVWPSMVTHTRNLFSAFNPSKCTLTAVNTHPEQWAAMLRRPGSSWGIGALLKGLTSVVVLKVERALVIHSPHRQFLPDLGIEPATFGLQVQLSNHKATAAQIDRSLRYVFLSSRGFTLNPQHFDNGCGLL